MIYKRVCEMEDGSHNYIHGYVEEGGNLGEPKFSFI
jgi:hypothetical protein